jgi:hypothetical protein
MKPKEMTTKIFRHPLLLLWAMIVINALFVYGWWPKASLGQTEFKWIQLVFILIPDIVLIIEFRRWKHEKR